MANGSTGSLRRLIRELKKVELQLIIESRFSADFRELV